MYTKKKFWGEVNNQKIQHIPREYMDIFSLENYIFKNSILYLKKSSHVYVSYVYVLVDR